MNIAINARFLLKDKLEGIGRFTYEITKRMVLANPDINFYFFFDRKYDESFIFADNVTPVVLYPQARHPLLYIIWFEYSVRNALKKYKIDVFLSTDGFLTLSTPVPTVLVVHDLAAIHFPHHIKPIQRWYYKKFTPLFVKKATKIIAVSKATKKDIEDTYDVNPSKIDVIYNACEFDKHIKIMPKEEVLSTYTDGKPYILFVGAIHPRKNVDNLILAFNILKEKYNKPLALLIVGRKAWNIDQTTKTYNASKYKSDIYFNPHISHEELPSLYKNAEVFSYVSRFEGFGIPLLEAMHYDTPVVTSNVSSMPEVVGESGLLASPESPFEISTQLLKVLEDKKLRNKMIVKSKLQRLKFDWDISSKDLFSILINVNS